MNPINSPKTHTLSVLNQAAVAAARPNVGSHRRIAKTVVSRQHTATDINQASLKPIPYQRNSSVDAFAHAVATAEPLQLIATERRGVSFTFIKALAKRMNLSVPRLLDILGVEHVGVGEKRVLGRYVSGASGQAALGVLKLRNIIREMIDESGSADVTGFDSFKWLGRWIEHPVPALGGRKPADLIDTPTGVRLVAMVLETIRGGAYL